MPLSAKRKDKCNDPLGAEANAAASATTRYGVGPGACTTVRALTLAV